MTTKTVAELATLCGAELEGEGTRVVDGAASLAEATPREVSFFANPRYKDDLLKTRAGAVLVRCDESVPRADLTLLRCKDPSAAFNAVVRAFVPSEPPPAVGVHASATVDPTAELGEDVSIGPACVVGPGVRLGDRVVLHANVTIGRGVAIGADSVLHPSVVAYPGIRIGARCIVHAGAVLGADGYGFDPGPNGWQKIPQCGTVVIEDDVEIGANTCIDRGRFGATRIARGAKLDNLVHIAHNVVVGEGALLIAQVGVAGSTKIGRRAILAGQVGVNGHIEIGDGARLAAQAGVFGDVPPGADYLGWPARPRGDALRTLALTQRLPQLVERLRALEQKLAEIERKDR
jgi:UDP-3-O-[3-hydroxymyristoyl] glucosamine N-acyltransferase